MPKTKTLIVPTHNGFPTTQWNEYNVTALKEIIQKKEIKTAIDIGAWWGPWTIEMAPVAKNIICFEANTEIQSLLEQNTKEYPNVKIYKQALSSHEWSVPMSAESHSGTYGVKTEGNLVNVKPLDSYNFEDVDIIKIDVEGHEHSVLLGAKNTIVKNKPLIQIEINRKARFSVYKILEELGMHRIYKRFPDQIWSF